MNWPLSPNIHLASDRIEAADAARQTRTARAILERFDEQPGVILADEVGMGKTYVALAVAVSVIEATKGQHPVVVMIPPSIREKWPREWDVFREKCMPRGTKIRATQESVAKGSEFLKLLDDPRSKRNHIIFLTHGALTSSLTRPLHQARARPSGDVETLESHPSARRAASLGTEALRLGTPARRCRRSPPRDPSFLLAKDDRSRNRHRAG